MTGGPAGGTLNRIALSNDGIISPPYSVIAPMYDRLLGHVNYDYWYAYLRTLMLLHTSGSGLVAELGCGTGLFASRFSRDGHTVLGIDHSLEMLSVARARGGSGMHLCCADITDFTLACRAEFVYCIHDTVNYLLGEDRVRSLFRCVKDILHPRGLFLFDITTEYNVRANFNRKRSTFRIADARVVWTNSYDSRERIITSCFDIDMRDARFREIHRQKVYPPDMIEGILGEEGFECLTSYGDNTFDRPSARTVMINYLARLK